MASPFTLVGAAGLGFAVAWFYPRRRVEADETGEQGTSVLASIMSGLNLAGMVLSMFPASTSSGDQNTDPR